MFGLLNLLWHRWSRVRSLFIGCCMPRGMYLTFHRCSEQGLQMIFERRVFGWTKEQIWMAERDNMFPTSYRLVSVYQILTTRGSRSVPRCHDILELTVKATNLEHPVWPLIPDIGTRRPSSILSTTGWEADPVLFLVDFRTRGVVRLADKADCITDITHLLVRWLIRCLDKFHTCEFAVVC